jgi:hypothetical protein
MKKAFQFIVLVMSSMAWISCDDEFTDDLVKDNKPEVPVTFAGATTHGFNPYYTVSKASGTIAITLEIPESSGRSIKAIRKVTAGATGLTPGSLLDNTTAYASNISVNATSFTFTTSITEFDAKMTVPANRVPATIAAGTFAERAFMFAVVLDDDTEIIPVQCRIRFVP